MSAGIDKSGPVKAYLEIKERTGPSTGGGPAGGTQLADGLGTLTFRFNPKQYTVGKSAQWHSLPRSTGDTSAPPAEYLGPEARTLTLELLLDESDSATGDVSKDVNALLGCCNPRKATNMPPVVTFGWGQIKTFEAYVTQVSVRYTMFRQSGTPYRAAVSLSLKEHLVAPKRQNPTSGAPTSYRTHLVVAGDSLPSIAHIVYGDPARWRQLAEANAIDDPLRLPTGVRLLVPPPSEPVAR